MRKLKDQAQAERLALTIVDTLPEPFLVLDETLHLLAASRCFYEVYERTRPMRMAAPFSNCPAANGIFQVYVSCCGLSCRTTRVSRASSLKGISGKSASGRSS